MNQELVYILRSHNIYDLNNFIDNNIKSKDDLINITNVSILNLKKVPSKIIELIIIMLKDDIDLINHTIHHYLNIPKYKLVICDKYKKRRFDEI